MPATRLRTPSAASVESALAHPVSSAFDAGTRYLSGPDHSKCPSARGAHVNGAQPKALSDSLLVRAVTTGYVQQVITGSLTVENSPTSRLEPI